MPHIALSALDVDDHDGAVAYRTGPLGYDLVEDADGGDDSRRVVVRPRGTGTGTGTGTEPAWPGSGTLLARAANDGRRPRAGTRTGGRVRGRVGSFPRTDDFARDNARMPAAGVAFAVEPRHEPHGTVAVFPDLYGSRWDLLQGNRGDLLETAS
jgi:hypothetical protein